MKKLLTILSLVAITATSGCTTVQSTLADPTKVTAICTVLQSGVSTLTTKIVQSKPADKVYLQLVAEALQLATNQGTFDPQALQTILFAKIPTEYQADVTLALNSALVAYSTFYALNLSSWKTSVAPLAQALTAIQNGITQGLSTVPAGPVSVKPITSLTVDDLKLN